MPIPLEIILKARKYRIGAVEHILSECYPKAHRMAYGLTGRADLGRQIMKQVVRRALRQMPSWNTEGEPERWFDHHTILFWRRVSAYHPDAREDLLVSAVAEPSAAYMAFVRAMRQLPVQQREAFLLNTGEGYDARQSGIAMDCSREAAANHLSAARAELSAVSGTQAELERHARTLAAAWRGLTTRPQIMLPALRRTVRRHVWARRLRRAIKTVLVLIIIALIAWTAWRARENL